MYLTLQYIMHVLELSEWAQRSARYLVLGYFAVFKSRALHSEAYTQFLCVSILLMCCIVSFKFS